MLHEAVFIQCQQCNSGVMFTAQCSRRKVIFDEILCWVDNCRQLYNALPTGNQDIVSSLAQWGLTKPHGWRSQVPWCN